MDFRERLESLKEDMFSDAKKADYQDKMSDKLFRKKYKDLNDKQKKEIDSFLKKQGIESFVESFKVGDKFSNKYGDWIIINSEGSKNDMYALRGKSGVIVVDEDTLKKYYTKKESCKESLKEDIREGKDVMTPDGIGEYITTLNTGWILVLFPNNTKKQYPKKDIKFLESCKESLKEFISSREEEEIKKAYKKGKGIDDLAYDYNTSVRVIKDILQESYKEVKGKNLDSYTYTLMNYVNALRRDGKSDEEIFKSFKKDFPNVQASDEQLKRFIKKESYKERLESLKESLDSVLVYVGKDTAGGMQYLKKHRIDSLVNKKDPNYLIVSQSDASIASDLAKQFVKQRYNESYKEVKGKGLDYSEVEYKFDKFLPDDEELQMEYYKLVDRKDKRGLLNFFKNEADYNRMKMYFPRGGTLEGFVKYLTESFQDSLGYLKEKFNKKEKLTLDDVARREFGKRYQQLEDDEKKEVNYKYSEWTDESDYDEGCKRESSNGEYLKAQKLLTDKGLKNDDTLRKMILYWLDKGKSAEEINKIIKESYKESFKVGDYISYQGRVGKINNISGDKTIAEIEWNDKKNKDTNLPIDILKKFESYKERLQSLKEDIHSHSKLLDIIEKGKDILFIFKHGNAIKYSSVEKTLQNKYAPDYGRKRQDIKQWGFYGRDSQLSNEYERKYNISNDETISVFKYKIEKLKKESCKERLRSLKETQRYGKVEGRDVFIMDKATKAYAKKGYIIIQDLKTGNSYEIPENAVKNITTKYPESYKEGQIDKWQDVGVGDNALVKSKNMMGVVMHSYGRKFNVKTLKDGVTKTYDADDLEFYESYKERLQSLKEAIEFDKYKHCGVLQHFPKGTKNPKCSICGKELTDKKEAFQENLSDSDIINKVRTSDLLVALGIGKSGNHSRDIKAIEDKLKKISIVEKKKLLSYFGLKKSYKERLRSLKEYGLNIGKYGKILPNEIEFKTKKGNTGWARMIKYSADDNITLNKDHYSFEINILNEKDFKSKLSDNKNEIENEMNKKILSLKESYKERLRSLKEASINVKTQDGKEVTLEVSGSGTKGSDVETGEDYQKVGNEWKKKLENIK